jgi:hypothetical protein
MWRQAPAGLLMTLLVVVPSAATVCEVFCVDGSAAHASPTSGTRSHHDASTPPASSARLAAAASHDCVDHASAREARARVRRFVESGNVDGPLSDMTQSPLRLSVGSIAFPVQSTHGPPGFSLSAAPTVLRI